MNNTSGRSPTGNRAQTSGHGKTSVSSNKTKQGKKGSMIGRIGRALLTAFLIFVITCTLICGAVAIYVINYVKPQNIDLSSADLDSTTIMYANNGKTKIAQVNGQENRIWVKISKMPTNLQNAFVCTEDQRFYEHEGVDWKRTVSSFANLFLHFYGSRQGGSTITQQLANNKEKAGKGSKDIKDWSRKMQEIVNALALEKKYSKSQILEAYLNTISFDEGCYGVETASENYFGKSVDKLDLTECAALACLPKAPYTYDPRLHPEKNADRRKIVLGNMYKQGKISEAQYNAALKEKLKIAAKKTRSVRGWFPDMVISDVENDLVAKYGWEKSAALDEIYTKGLRIYTTENTAVQNAMDKVYRSNSEDYWYTYNGTKQPQSSMMVVDYTGQIQGVEGGRGIKSGNMLLNRASSSTRAPGSSIKPLAVYGPALDLNKITWSTLISKKQIINSATGQLWPQNDGNKDYSGSYSIAEALARSVNTVAVNIENTLLSPEYSYNFLTQKLGFTTLDSQRDQNLGIAIGSLTHGVTPEEMCGGYEIFGNGGVYYKPHSYTLVTDSQGNVLLQYKAVATQAIGSDTACIMNKLLQNDVTSDYGTGRDAAIPGIEVGGKTGTTNDKKDRWFAGITPEYVGVVWFGYDRPQEVDYYDWENPALKAWHAVMEQVEENAKKTSFDVSSNVVSERYNSYTGYVSSGGDSVGWYKADALSAGTSSSSTE